MNGPSPSQYDHAEGYAEGFAAGVEYRFQNSHSIATRTKLSLITSAKKFLEESDTTGRLASGSTVVWETVEVTGIKLQAPYRETSDQFVTVTGSWTFTGSDRGTFTSTKVISTKQFQLMYLKAIRES